MRFSILIFVAIAVLLISCGKKDTGVKLSEGTPAYQLAKDLSQKVPELDPEQNRVLVSGKDLNLTVGEVLMNIQSSYGLRANQLKNLDATRLKTVILRNAESMAEKTLLLRAAKAAGFSASDVQVDSVLSLQYARMGGEDKFTEMLVQAGIDIANVKKDIREGLTIQNYLSSTLAAASPVSEEEIEAAYNEPKTVTVRHILLNTQGKSDEEKKAIREKMEELLKRARSGEDFETLAREYSEDPGSKSKGGLYENITRGQMVKPFEDAAFSVPVGQISDVIETQFGYHIVKVVSRNKEKQPLDAVRDQLKEQLGKQKEQEAYQKLIAGLREAANMKVESF